MPFFSVMSEMEKGTHCRNSNFVMCYEGVLKSDSLRFLLYSFSVSTMHTNQCVRDGLRALVLAWTQP